MASRTELRVSGPPYLRGPGTAFWYVWWFADPLKCMREAYRRYGPLMAIGTLNPWRKRDRKYVLAIGPEMNRLVLGDMDSFRTGGVTMRGPAGSAINRIRNGIHRMSGEQHRQQRKLISPLFCRKSVESYCRQIVEITRRFLNGWEHGQTFDLSRQMHHLSLEIASQLLFGREEPQQAFHLGEMLKVWVHQTYDRGLWLLPLNLPGSPYRRRLDHGERLVAEMLSMMNGRRGSLPECPDMLDMLVQSRDAEGMTDDDVLGQISFLFGASYETVANALTWTMFLLAQHPQSAADVCEELDELLDGGEPDEGALEQMPRLEAAIKESMRILPAVPITLRYALRPMDFAGLRLRRADRVICSHYMTHHLPELFPDPERFLPSRWESISPGPFDYLPFGAGPHYCAGSHLAMTMMKLVLGMILPQWRLQVVPGARIDRSIRVTLSSKQGLPVRVFKQDGRFEASEVRGNIREMVELSAGQSASRATRLNRV